MLFLYGSTPVRATCRGDYLVAVLAGILEGGIRWQFDMANPWHHLCALDIIDVRDHFPGHRLLELAIPDPGHYR